MPQAVLPQKNRFPRCRCINPVFQVGLRDSSVALLRRVVKRTAPSAALSAIHPQYCSARNEIAPTCPQHFPVCNMGMFPFMAFTQIINFSEITRTTAASLSAPSEPLPKIDAAPRSNANLFRRRKREVFVKRQQSTCCGIKKTSRKNR